MREDLLDILRCPATGAHLSLETLDRDGDEIRSGVLSAEGAEYPVVAGVPVLLRGYEGAVGLLRGGRPLEAAADALLQQLPVSRLGRLAAAAALAPGGVAMRRAAVRRDRARLRHELAGPLDARAEDPLALIRLGFLGWDRNPEAVHYFTYRFGTPRHLVALAAAESAADDDRPVLDLGCGAGHLTWGLGQRFGHDRTVGVNRSLFELWTAQRLNGGAHYVCGDATNLPFASGTFRFVMASDVLSFVHDKWAAAREALRALAEGGTLVVAAVKSSLQDHVYAGTPLSPAGWTRLVEPLPHVLHADDHVLERYLAGQGLDPDDPGDVSRAPTVTLVAGAGAARRPGGWPDAARWPHARGPLGLNPLLRFDATSEAGLVYRRSLPSANFAADNAPLTGYLPEVVVVPAAAVAGDAVDERLTADLVASSAVLALPSYYRRHGLPTGHPRRVGA